MFVEVSRERGIHFIVETHSEHVFRRMQTLIAQNKTHTEHCAMYFIERKGAHAHLKTLTVDEFGAVANWPVNFFGDAVGEARVQAQARAQRARESSHG
jgi:predicted ATPase